MYNLAIIGGGPAGYTAAELAQKAGWSVVLFEETALGGTCLNVGCIPTKTLLYSAKQYYNLGQAQKYGITAQELSFDYLKMQQRKQKVVRKLVAGIRQRLQGTEVVNGVARVIDRTDDKVTIEANENTYEAERLMICTGSLNFVPPIPGVQNNPYVWNSTDALDAKQLPSSIVIVGGGVIGMEFATLYHELGVSVTVVEALPRILPQLDADCVEILQESYKKKGVMIHTSTKVTQIEGGRLTLQDETGDLHTIEAERILVCVGRRANLKGLELLHDLELERGAVKVNNFMQTNLANVYAAGDVTGKVMLAHAAARQAEVAIGRMLKQIPLQRMAYNAIPSVVYTNPELAAVGLTEKQTEEFYRELEGDEAFQRKGGNDAFFEVKKLPMTWSGRFVAENEGETGLCKIIIDRRNQTVLGVHCAGNPASEFIAAASFAVRMGYTVSEFRQVVFPHPTVSEILKEVINE